MRVFRFNLEKTIQAAAFLLRREKHHRMNYMRLLKVLYLAERESFQESGKPLTGSVVVASERGPVLEDVLSLIRCQHVATPRWSEFFQVDRYDMVMIKDPGIGRLSKFLTEKLESIAQQHEHHDEWDMAQFTRGLAECPRNDLGDLPRVIPLEHILQAVGRGDDYERIIESAKGDALVADFFSETLTESAAQSNAG